MKTLKIVAIIIAVLLVAVIALPFFINVNSFRPRLESELSAALGRSVKVGNLSLSILSGSVGAENISIADDPNFSRDPFVQAKSLEVGVELIPLLFSKTLHITNLTLEGPQIVLLHAASGRWNFSSLGEAGKTSEKKSDSSSAAGANFSISKLKVKAGRLSINQANSSRPPHVYENVNIEVHNFSFASQFPFTMSADLPGKGSLELEGTAGPINANDASATPLKASMKIRHLDLAASGFVEPSSGIGGLADFDGTLDSDGELVRTSGTVNAQKLKLSPKGSPSPVPVQVKYAIEHDLERQAGTLKQGDISLGKALAKLAGTYQTRGDSTLLNMKLDAEKMPVDELQAMLPALGVVLPSGSSLKGGTLSTALAISGTAEKPLISGPIRLVDTRLAGFNLGSKLSAISALSGAKTGADTSIQNFSTETRVAPEGIQTDNINLTIPSLGVLTGNGTISPSGALNYKMSANVSGSAVTGLMQVAGVSGKGGSIPFFIQGTTSDPKFVPDVQGMVGGRLKNQLPAGSPAGSAIDSLTGLFGKKKKNQ